MSWDIWFPFGVLSYRFGFYGPDAFSVSQLSLTVDHKWMRSAGYFSRCLSVHWVSLLWHCW